MPVCAADTGAAVAAYEAAFAMTARSGPPSWSLLFRARRRRRGTCNHPVGRAQPPAPPPALGTQSPQMEYSTKTFTENNGRIRALCNLAVTMRIWNQVNLGFSCGTYRNAPFTIASRNALFTIGVCRNTFFTIRPAIFAGTWLASNGPAGTVANLHHGHPPLRRPVSGPPRSAARSLPDAPGTRSDRQRIRR
jgi:hypothetical protein